MKLLLLFIFLSLPLVAQAKKQSIEINFELSHNKKAPIKFKVITRAGQEAQISNHLRGVEETRITATPTVDKKGHLTLDMAIFKSFKGIPVINAKPKIKTLFGQTASIEQYNEETGEGYSLKVIAYEKSASPAKDSSSKNRMEIKN